MTTARVAGHDFDLDPEAVEKAITSVDPEPIREHYAVIAGRRYPPKQVLAAATGLDRADFTTHQARSILRRLGFGVFRKRLPTIPDPPTEIPSHIRAEAEALRPFMGRWIAQDGLDVLFDADSPEAVVRWLRMHGRKAAVWRVPSSPREAGSFISTPPW